MPLVLTGATSGSVTVDVPAVAGTNTLTIPANTGTIITTGSTGQVIPKAALPSGSILQVVSVTKTDTFSSSASTETAVTGLAATITPTSSTSKVFVMINFNAGGNTSTANCDYYFYRNGSKITAAIGDASGSEQRSAAHFDPAISRMNFPYIISYLDSPASTSAQTYQLYQKAQSGGYTFYINRGNLQDGNTGVTISTITLMEISA